MARLEVELVDSGIAVIRFVNPPTGLLTAAMASELETHANALGEDPRVRAVILTGGQPDIFIRHFDVRELATIAESTRSAPPAEDAEWHSSVFHRITRCLELMPKPVVAAINGVCMGVGYELALACDLRIASRGDYPIGLPEVNIGTCPGGGGTVRLTRLLGVSHALEMLYSGVTCLPDRAADVGLVNWVSDDALADALSLAQAFLPRSAAALAAIKMVSRTSADLGLEAALTVEQRVVNARLRTPEMASLMRQMNERDLDIRDVQISRGAL